MATLSDCHSATDYERLRIAFAVGYVVLDRNHFENNSFLLMKASLFLGLLLGLLLAESVEAGVTRISIVLIGQECAVQRPALADQLTKVPGIVFVDGRSVPDHLLIDVEEGTATVEQLVDRVNKTLGSQPCRAEEMKSCITADLILSTR